MANRFKAINVSLGSTKNKPIDAEVTSMQGRRGDPGPYFIPSVDTEGNISWENNGGLPNPTTRNIKGPKGDDGNDGSPGATGPQGPQGQAGVSPSISVTDIPGGHRVTITDTTGDHSFDVMDGEGSVISVNGKTGEVKLYYEVTTREQLILASYDAGVNVPFLFKASGQLVTDLGGQTNYSALGLGMVNGQYTGHLFFILLQAGATRFRYGYINVTLGTVTFSGQVANTGDIPSFPSSGVPSALGTASQGSANTVARSDHVHQMPSASDVGALPNTTVIPTKTSDLTNDSGFITTETDPTVPAWAKAASKPSYTKSEVGLGNVDNVQQYSASNPPPYPVTSVNGKTGAVVVKAIHFTVSITALPCTVTDSRITADMRVIEAVLGTPGAVTTDLGWTTANGSIVFSGTLASGGSTTLDFDLIEVVT